MLPAMLARPRVPEPGTGDFVGRERELLALRDGLAQARSRRGGLFLIGGEPGIGKSRLVDEFAREAREQGIRVLWGKGWEGAGAPAYWPWMQALRSYVRSVEPADARAQMGMGAADLTQMLPELRSLFPDLPPPPPDSDSARFQLFDSATGFLRNAAGDTGLVVVLDDLHAADTPSVLFLRFLAGQLGDTSLLLVCTFRDIELTPQHPLTSAIGDLTREPTTRLITLGGLQQQVIGPFIASAAGQAADERLVGTLWRETRGNPLFLGETIRLLLAEGRIGEVSSGRSLHVSVPAGIRETIVQRVARLGSPTIDALRWGAALGPEFSLEVLRRSAGYGADEALDLLGGAVGAGLLTAVAGSPGHFRFAHDLFREAVYGALAPGERVRLHRRITEGLEELYGASVDMHLAELAHHAFEAAEGGGVTTALDYARRAGDQASSSVAYEEAARLYRMALAVLDLAETPDPESRTEILLALGEVEGRAGDLQASRAILLEAADIARRNGMARHLARAAVGIGGRLPWTRPGRDRRLIPLLQDALVHLGGADEPLRIRLLTRLACAWRSSPGRRDESAALSSQAVEAARRLGDPATLSYALGGRFWAIWWPENPADRLPIAEEMVAVAETLGDGERLIDAHLMLYMSHTETGQMTTARRYLEDVARLAEDLRQPSHLWLGVAPAAEMALMEGDFGRAAELMARETEPDHPTTTALDDVSAARMHRFLLRREQGRLAEEEASVRASVEEFPWYPLHRGALACLLVDLGRRDEARAVFGDLARDRFRAFYPDNEWLLGICLVAEACALLSDTAAAAVLYEQLAPFAGRHAIGHAEGSVGAVDRYLGLLAETLDRLDDGERHFVQAIELNDRMGARPWAAHARSDLARLLRRRDATGDRRRAEQLDGEALATARELGMPALAARLGSEAADEHDVPSAGGITSATFLREGEYWTVRYGTDGFRIRDAKGLRYLARLLADPGREMLSLDLVREGAPAAAAHHAEAELGSRDDGDAGVQLDDQARAEYRRRLAELAAEVAEAEAWNDAERAERAEREAEFLKGEIARAVGLGGRQRRAASAAERARLSATRAIRLAITRIARHSPGLAKHLDTTIHTGTFCAYRPDGRIPITWQL
jgi:tetratricopeptide (TPR) repeat protein